MIKTTYECECGQFRKESNHWFIVEESNGGELLISKWSLEVANHVTAEHICGEACLSKRVARWVKESKVKALANMQN
jgi:hypothetical protein